VAEGEGGAHPTQMHKKKEKSGWKAPKKQQHYELRYNGGKRQMSGREKGGWRVWFGGEKGAVTVIY